MTDICHQSWLQMSITFHGMAADFNSTATLLPNQTDHPPRFPATIYWAQGARSLVLSFCRFLRYFPLTIDYAPLYSNNERGKTSKRLPAPSTELSFVASCAVTAGRQCRSRLLTFKKIINSIFPCASAIVRRFVHFERS